MTGNTLTHQVNIVLKKLTEDIKNNKLDLPSPPDLLVKIRTAAANQDTTAADLTDLVRLDFNISGRLIKVANCALFGSRFHVTSVKSAIARLGMARVQHLIVGLAIAQNLMTSRTRGLESYFKQTWEQSNTVAAICYVLAKHKTGIDPEQALLAGMVHNIGALPLMLRLNTIRELRDNPNIMKMVADVVIPKLYPSAGKLILEHWNFPANISQIAIQHVDIQRPSPSDIDLNDLVQVAHQMSLHHLQERDENDLAELVASDSFIKFWPSWELAEQDMSEFEQEIKQIKTDMTS